MVLKLYTINCNRRNNSSTNHDIEMLRKVFNLRYQVYHDEMGVVPENPEKEISDIFDFIPYTWNFLVADDDEPVGVLRLTKYSDEYGLPIFYSSKELKNQLDKKINLYERIKNGSVFSEGSRFVVSKDYRRRSTGGKSLVSSILAINFYDECKKVGITDILIVANPNQINLYKKVGFEEIGKKIDELTGIDSPIMYAKLDGGFKQFMMDLKFKLAKKMVYRIPNNSIYI
jgi:N-acyl-L-homoserine lactone synthetase